MIEETDNPNEREKYWINYYNSFNDGYNATKVGKDFQLLIIKKFIRFG